MSLYRGGPGDQATQLDTLDRFRNSVVDSVDLGDWHLDGARRMSITNAIDILRRHVMKAIKRKKDRHLVYNTRLFMFINCFIFFLLHKVDNIETVWTEPGLTMIG